MKTANFVAAVGHALTPLRDPARAGQFDADNRADQERLRDAYSDRERKPLLPIAEAVYRGLSPRT